MRLTRVFQSTAFRFALAYSALFAGSALALVGFIYWGTAGYIERHITELIRTDMESLLSRYAEDGLAALQQEIQQRIAEDEEGRLAYLLADPEGGVVAGNMRHWSDMRFEPAGWLQVTIPQDTAGRERVLRLRQVPLANGYYLLAGRDIREQTEVQWLIVDALAWSLGFILLLAGGGAIAFRRILMGRVERFNRVSEEIMRGDLSRRVPVAGSDDEFDLLAATQNRMLDRIEQLMEGIRHVSDTIAHDLRSPLARLRGRLEAAARTQGDADTYRAALDRAVSDVDDVIRLFNSLLRISQIEAGARRAAFQTVDAAALVLDVGELYEPVAEERRIAIRVQAPEPCPIQGDSSLLSQAIANLVDNAVKYTPPGGGIDLSANIAEGAVTIMVTDSGPGIPSELREKVVQRFYRLDDSRSTPGHGLGLALADAVARLHGGELTLAERAPPPGLAVHIRLPMAAAPVRATA